MESRLRQIRNRLGLRQEQIAEIFDCKKENISMIERGKSALSERNKKCLVKKFNLNPLWLEGENVPMLSPAAQHAARMEERPARFPASVPLYDLENIPSLTELFRRTSEGRLPRIKGCRCGGKGGRPSKEDANFSPAGWINIPGLPPCDGALRFKGEAMSPILRSGDVVMYKQLDSPAEIFWGEAYLVAVEISGGEYVSVRYLRRSPKEGFALLSGENPAFADTEVELSRILALALVKGSIRMNSAK